MRRGVAKVALIALTLLAGAGTPASAQFQTCIFCDVTPFTPDPLSMMPCDSGTVVLKGAGFEATSQNGCSNTPTVDVRSTRPDRLQIDSFTVLNDGRIEINYTVPCTATEGMLGIDVRIDDDARDSTEAYACGNARVEIGSLCGNRSIDQDEECDDGNRNDDDGCSAQCKRELILAVVYQGFAVVGGGDGVEVRWRTIEETGTLAFDVWGREGGVERRIGRLLARGAGSDYRFRDGSPGARSGATTAYRVVEWTEDGRPGSATGWTPVQRPPEGAVAGGGRGRRPGM